MNDAKYIGLDVHQATISAVVLDSNGKLVMESILETKAATILQFIHGLRGSLHVTFEEGTCAAWLHDLLKPHVTQVLVCDPRKNALLKVRKQERPHRCSQAGRSSAERTALAGLPRRERRADPERTGPQLPGGHPGSHAGDESAESSLQKLGDSLRGRASLLRRAIAQRVAGQDHRSRRAPPGGVLLPATRRLQALRQQVRRRSAGREQETSGHRICCARFLRLARSGRPC